MASTLGTIIYVSLLLVNAIAILSEERFLARVGWSSNQAQTHSFESAGFGGAGGGDVGVKTRLVNLISAVRTLLRVPLIILNTVIIIYEVLLG